MTEKLEGVNKPNKELEEVLKTNPEIITPQLAIKNTQNKTSTQLPVQNTQNDTQPGIIYDTSLENTFSTMKNKNKYVYIVENENGDNFWNGVEVIKLGGSEKQLRDDVDEYGFCDIFQDGILNKTFLKDLNDIDTLTFYDMLHTLKFDQYKHPVA